jgi:hypothetical protein
MHFFRVYPGKVNNDSVIAKIIYCSINEIIMNAKVKGTEKRAMIYFKVISWHLPGMTEKKHKRNSVMAADNLIKYQAKDLLKTCWVYQS